MGRGVNYDSDAVQVWYLDSSCECNPHGCDCWDYLEESIVSAIAGRYRSLISNDGRDWVNRETRVILENDLCKISISEYCGCTSISLAPKESPYQSEAYMDNLAQHWCSQVIGGIHKVLSDNFPTSLLTKLGSFSNGESVYERAVA